MLLLLFFQVQTKLENPTHYYVMQQQKRQVKQYLKNQPPPSSVPGGLHKNVMSTSQPTLNALNQQAVANITGGPRSLGSTVKTPQSPMSVTSPDPASAEVCKHRVYWFLIFSFSFFIVFEKHEIGSFCLVYSEDGLDDQKGLVLSYNQGFS